MKNLVSLIVFALVFLGLGAMALMAAPGGADLVAEFNPSETAGSAPQAESQEVTASESWNVIAVPLHVSSVSLADDVNTYAGGGIVKVGKWVNGGWQLRTVGGGFGAGTNFAVSTGMPLILLADNNAAQVISWVGDVPDVGTVQNTGIPQVGGAWHVIMVPLDTDVDTNADGAKADELGAELAATKVGQWVNGGWQLRTVGGGFGAGTNFTIKIGYPYIIQTTAGTPSTWPSP